MNEISINKAISEVLYSGLHRIDDLDLWTVENLLKFDTYSEQVNEYVILK